MRSASEPLTGKDTPEALLTEAGQGRRRLGEDLMTDWRQAPWELFCSHCHCFLGWVSETPKVAFCDSCSYELAHPKPQGNLLTTPPDEVV